MNFKTSKHSGVISIFDKHFVHTGKFEKKYSKMIHRMFNLRQEADYKEWVQISRHEAIKSIEHATLFLNAIKNLIENNID